MSRHCSTLVAAALAWATGGRAQGLVLQDDFDDGGFSVSDTPAGPWEVYGCGGACGTNVSLGVATGAAHAGARGVRVIENDAASGGRLSEMRQWFDGGFFDRYVRFWFHVVPASATGRDVIATLYTDDDGFTMPWGLEISNPNSELILRGIQCRGGFTSIDTGYAFDAGWHLVEGAILGSGTTSGQRVVWVDGVEVGRVGNVNMDVCFTDDFRLGTPWSDDATYRGTLDFDQAAVLNQPPASKVVIDAGTLALASNRCAAIAVELTTSAGGSASAYRPEQLRVSIRDGGATVYSDALCTTPGVPLIPAGASATVLGVRPSFGPLLLFADTDNLLGSEALWIVADGGPGSSGLPLNVGCDCSSAPRGTALLIASLWGLRRGRARRRT